MTILAVDHPIEPGVLRTKIETDHEFLKTIEDRISKASYITRFFSCISNKKHEEAKLLIAAQLLLEQDEGKMRKTVTLNDKSIYITLGPLEESKAEHKKRLQSLKATVDTCTKEAPACTKTKWFQQHQKKVNNFKGRPKATFTSQHTITSLTKDQETRLSKLCSF